MELDFTGLEKLSHRNAQDARLEDGQGNHTAKGENAVYGTTVALQGIAGLQREADRRKTDKEGSAAAYRAYQDNTKATGEIQAEILKGVRNGENIYTLFLKAAKAISLMTGNGLFYSQLRADIIAIHGRGLRETVPLEMDLEETQERLRRLREAGEPENANLKAAIKAHEERAERLRAMLENERAREDTMQKAEIKNY